MKLKISKIFIKAQIASLVATIVDYSLTFILTHFINVWYVVSSASGTIGGGCVNFILSRYLVFKSTQQRAFLQIIKYISAWFLNLLINTLGIYLLTDCLKINYLVSKIIMLAFVSFPINFFMQKNFVFKSWKPA